VALTGMSLGQTSEGAVRYLEIGVCLIQRGLRAAEDYASVIRSAGVIYRYDELPCYMLAIINDCAMGQQQQVICSN